MASGSSVPAWPTFRVPRRRRQRATTSCDVQPACLSTTIKPPGSSIPPAGRLRPAGLVRTHRAGHGAVPPPRARLRRQRGRRRNSASASVSASPRVRCRLEITSPCLEQGEGALGQGGHVDRGVTEVRFHPHAGDRQQRQPVVVVAEPLEGIAQHLHEDGVDTRGPRIASRRTAIVLPSYGGSPVPRRSRSRRLPSGPGSR